MFRLSLALVVTALADLACVGGNTFGMMPQRQVPATATSVTFPTPTAYGLQVRPQNTSCSIPPPPVPANSNVVLTPVFTGLQLVRPVALRQRAGDTARFYVAEASGKITYFPNDPAVNEGERQVLIDMSSTFQPGQSLHDLAIPLHLATEGHFYTSVADGNTVQILQLTTADNGNSALPTPLTELSIPSSTASAIKIAGDQTLYIAVQSDPQDSNSAQDTNTWLGKILRIDPRKPDTVRNLPYSIPVDNPYSKIGGAPQVWATGLKNPTSLSFDRDAGTLYLTDNAAPGIQEINSAARGGANFGYPLKTATICATPPCSPTLTDPLYVDNGNAILFGYVYEGSSLPQLVGQYIYGDTQNGNIYSIAFNRATNTYKQSLVIASGMILTAFAEDESGQLYVLAGDHIYRLDPADPPRNDFPQTLSTTGCFDPNDVTQPGPALIPYSINMPLWSDGAGKGRWFALPDGSTLHISDDGNILLPVGSVVFKEFARDNVRLETRMLVHYASGWAGFTYRWNDAQTDATLLAASQVIDQGSGTWNFPSRTQCGTCHNKATAGTLGLLVGQLARTNTYRDGDFEQLPTLAHIGLFDGPLPANFTTFPTMEGNASVEARARAYLHQNCSICHRPGGPPTPRIAINFLATTPLAMMNICNTTPQDGTMGVANAALLTPGHPEASMISLRMHTLTSSRMPPLGSKVIDPNGTSVVDAWISGLQSCP